MGTTVESLNYDLEFSFNKKTFESFNKSLKSSIAGFAKLGTVLIAAQAASFAQAKSVAEEIDGLDKLSRQLNTTTEDYQRLAFASNENGASNESLTSSLRNLAKAQEDVLEGKGDLNAFAMLDINPADFDKSSDLLLAISDSISKIDSDSQKISLLNRIGVSTDLLQTLEGGSSAIRALSKDFDSLGATITEDQKKVAGEFQAVWLRTTTIIGGASRKVGVDSLRTINKFLDKFVKFAQKNMATIIKSFEKFFEIVNKATSFLFEVLTRVFMLVGRITQLMGGLENAVIAASIAFVILKRRMLLAFAIPLVVATALFVVIDDIVAGLSGKESFFGDLLDKLDPIYAKLEGIRDFILSIVAGIGSVANIIPGVNISRLNFTPSAGNIDTSRQNFGGQNIQAPGASKTANITVNVNGANGDVVQQINTHFQQLSNSILGE